MAHEEGFKEIGQFEFRHSIYGKNTKTAKLMYKTLFCMEEDPFYQYVLISENVEIFNIHIRTYLSVSVALDFISKILKEWPDFNKFNNNAYRQEGFLHWTPL